jgi:hypothetical protein
MVIIVLMGVRVVLMGKCLDGIFWVWCGDGRRMVAGGLWWMAKEEDLIWEIREG